MCVNDSADRPAREKDEIEVTPEMLGAGDAALCDVADSDARVGLITSTELAPVYRAMRRLEPVAPRTGRASL